MSLLQPLDEIQQTLAEYERLAISTEQWNGTEPPEFSDDGERWSAAWRPSEPGQFPSFCRATVYRRDVDHPTIVVVRWDEALPTDDQWRQLWFRKPTTMLGSFARRAALRSAFRDVLGDRRGPDEEIVVVQPASSRDWAADLATASTPDEVRAVWAEAKAARVVTPQLEIAIRRRLYDVQDEAPDPVPAPEEDEPQIPVRRQPQDHKPSTRKQQRRRKGRR